MKGSLKLVLLLVALAMLISTADAQVPRGGDDNIRAAAGRNPRDLAPVVAQGKDKAEKKTGNLLLARLKRAPCDCQEHPSCCSGLA